MAFKYRISILLLLLICEGLLLYSFLGRGWHETTATLYWLRALSIAAIPIAIGIICLCRGGRRISLRSLMILVAGVGAFITIATLPLLNAQRNRLATIALQERGARVRASTFTSSIFDQLGLPHHRSSPPVPSERPLPKWLRPLAGQLLDTPVDRQIREITIRTDDQMSLLLKSATKFASLDTILLHGPALQSSSIMNFSKSLSSFPGLEAILFENVHVPENCLSKLTGVRWLSIHAQNPPPAGASGFRLSNPQLKAIGDLPSLEVLSFFNYDLSDDDLSLVEPSQSLRYVNLIGTDVTGSGELAFKNAHPNCKFNRR